MFNVLETFIIIFILILILLVSELHHRAVVGILAAVLTIYFGVSYGLFRFEEVFSFIEYDTVLLILSIFILVQTLVASRFFDFLSLALVKIVGQSQLRVTVLLISLTFVFTLFMTSTISIVVLASITGLLYKRLKLDVKRTLIFEGAIANVAGLALSISSIPNIIVSSKIGLSFIEFLKYSFPLSIILFMITALFTFKLVQGGVDSETLRINPWAVVEDKSVLFRSLAIFTAFLVLTALSGNLGIPPVFIAMSLALMMFFFSGVDPDEVFSRVNWGIIFFVASFYIFIAGLEVSGVLNLLSSMVSLIMSSNIIISVIALLWVSAVVSAVVDNIPVMLLLIPIVNQLVSPLNLNPAPFYWALVFGGNLGGNLTTFGSPAMLIATEVARREGEEISFTEFAKTSVFLTLLLLTVSSIYLATLIAIKVF